MEVERFDAGVPRGTAALAVTTAERAAATATSLTGIEHRVDVAAVLAHLLLPLVVGDDVAPSPPRLVAGGGALHVDVLAEDEALLATLTASAPGAAAEEVAALAQECRLPVTPYRAPLAASGPLSASPRRDTVRRVLVPADVTVVDMTAMWAGPLASMLLAEWGARVVTVEPASRPDGLRGSPHQFAVLDHGKHRRPWDLRLPVDRAAFEDQVAAADVLLESFSDRVLPNLGYPTESLHRINPRLTIVPIRAFPAASAEASWVAYGRGVHAVSGLGVVDGAPTPSLLAYPDPLAGLLAFAAVLDALGAPVDGQVVEVSLLDAIAPLGATAGCPLGAVDDAAVAELRAVTGRRPGPVLVRR